MKNLKAEWINEEPEANKVYGGRSIISKPSPRTDSGRSNASDISIDVGQDGALVLRNYGEDAWESSSVYFYPQQLAHLRKALAMAMKQKREAAAKVKQAEAEKAKNNE